MKYLTCAARGGNENKHFQDRSSAGEYRLLNNNIRRKMKEAKYHWDNKTLQGCRQKSAVNWHYKTHIQSTCCNWNWQWAASHRYMQSSGKDWILNRLIWTVIWDWWIDTKDEYPWNLRDAVMVNFSFLSIKSKKPFIALGMLNLQAWTTFLQS